ncbi:vanadium-dependent haloperoxidase [Pseudoalteromonas luteoviolacea]|uniref:vanadium-dependent haloperoxidase n=1 Tax=Pseudoalteromonas luteoviolacea TaxID=43657 RepID=UPI001B3A7B61|nr:vanadium-dependent haloperoxidase [Pseudoalteromonas luteoviolacea]MBQ4879982.1 vanadium-dependent haloperoxidase [Pseudoalteromonas luteoviolacea]MBQ4908999.1 vanadium-dependent haloperoxidase [Pseudoalteromonas luteoviolacea]
MNKYLSKISLLHQIRKLMKLRNISVFLLSLICVTHVQANHLDEFDFDKDNGALDVVGWGSLDELKEHVSANYGDASLLFRFGVLITNAWYDASAPYHPTAVGVYSHLGRRPAEEATNRNINTAVIYASYRVLNSFMPTYKASWRKMLLDIGLDPDNNSTDLNTPIGIGNAAGFAVVAGRQFDGMNQEGDTNKQYNPMPYADYTQYKPLNTAYKLKSPSHWQPDMQRKGLGLYKIQQFVTPQFALAEPYSYDDPNDFEVPPPYNSNFKNKRAYRKQAKDVLAASANLTDEQKIKAELFDDKFRSLSYSLSSNIGPRNLSLLEFIQIGFMTNLAAFDAGIFVWQEKYRFDAVRPFSAIRKLYKDESVQAWGGPGKGTVSMQGEEWHSYLEEADHPEYPSATACFCNAHAQSLRKYFGDDNMVYYLPIPAGSSRVEPGVTPKNDIVISYNNWTDFAKECGQSRVWGGVHFQAAVDQSAEVCPVFGDLAYEYVSALVDGSAKLRAPSQGRPLSELPERFSFENDDD